MQYTGALLITDIMKEIGENTTDTNYRVFVLNWFQEAFDIMVNELRDHNFLNVVDNLNTVADTNGYSITSGELIQGNIINVRNKTDNYSLSYLDIFEIKRLNWDLETTGTPKYYYQYGYDLNKKSSLIYFYPIPNGIYNLEVSYKLQSYLFADDSTVVRIPRYLVSPLRFYVKSMAYDREGTQAESQKFLQLFYQQINSLNKKTTTIADETSLQINDIPDYTYRKPGRGLLGWDSIGGQSTSGVSSISIAVPSYMAESGSPVTAAGTITLSFNVQSGRKFFASPADGTSGAMSMRPIVANDLPTHTHLSADITDLSGGSSFLDTAFEVKDNLDNTKKLAFQVSGVTTATTRTLTIPDASGTIALTSNKLSAFASTSSSELAGVISDETGSGALVFATSPTLVTPVLGAATATSINGLTITSSTGTLTITNGKTVSFSNTLTFAGTDGSTITLGAGGTVVYTSTSQTLTNKTIDASSNTISNITEAMQTLADNTTNDASTSKHGYLKKLSNVSTEFMNGQGNWATPSGGGSSHLSDQGIGSTTSNTTTATQIYTYTLGAGVLSAGDHLEIECWFMIDCNGGANCTFHAELTIAGNRILDLQDTQGNGALSRMMYVKWLFHHLSGNTTNMQTANLDASRANGNTAAPLGNAGDVLTQANIYSTSAYDVSGSLVFSIKVKMDTANASTSFTPLRFLIRKVG